MTDSYVCSNCGATKPLSELDMWNSKNVITYECTNRKKCNANRVAIKVEKTHDDNKKMETSLKETFSMNLSDLEEINYRFKDCSIHYICKKNQKMYTWHKLNKKWSETDEKTVELLKKKMSESD
ncbi:hypothetical protein Catovirus_1_888 [Catovirus CTV1]|uniref:Uncharacterized protein n=1 Tax=Catovirus CTV1 TaxID=1977631 RepID=A0A1V0SB08_9VIRU|nr:hypothetical protein Catovirus_1_888 [Catovirus CTV1]